MTAAVRKRFEKGVAMLTLDFTFPGSGWSEAWIANGKQVVSLADAYISDIAGDLFQAITVLLQGSHKATCRWRTARGAYHWAFTRHNRQLRICIHWLPTSSGEIVATNAVLVFDAECAFSHFIRQLSGQFAELRHTLSREEYAERTWGHASPLLDAAQLRQLLKLAAPVSRQG